MSVEALIPHVEHFRWRVIQDALAEATSAYWLRRADALDAVGTPTCDLAALNCRRHARLLADTGLDQGAREIITAALTEGVL